MIGQIAAQDHDVGALRDLRKERLQRTLAAGFAMQIPQSGDPHNARLLSIFARDHSHRSF
jgi:hypothetical protein